jgi:hypothetical protein
MTEEPSSPEATDISFNEFAIEPDLVLFIYKYFLFESYCFFKSNILQYIFYI